MGKLGEFFKNMWTKVEGPYAGVSEIEWTKLIYRDSFSKYLPWNSYDPETGLYYNNDNTAGFVWECVPHNFSGYKVVESLDGLFKQGLPTQSNIQFLLYGDDYLEPDFDYYTSQTERDIPEIKIAKERMVEFLRDGAKGLAQNSSVPIRKFRLFVSVKFDEEYLEEKGFNLNRIKSGIFETLKGAQLLPREVGPNDILFMARYFFNGKIIKDNYNQHIPINKQIIKAETDIDVNPKDRMMKMGDRYFKCLTPKIYPEYLDTVKMNRLIGGIKGESDNGNQVLTPFLVSVNILTDKLKGNFQTKLAFLKSQKKGGANATAVMKRQSEMEWAVSLVEDNKQFCHLTTSMWVWSEDESLVHESLRRLSRLWEGEGFDMQEEAQLLTPMMIASIPFGFYPKDKKELDLISRSFVVPESSAVAALITQADFMGNGLPYLLFIGRKGQLIGIDITSNSTNYNGYIVAGSGAGKSLLMNSMVSTYFANGSKIRIIDIGFSYEKLTQAFDGKFVDFNKDSDICINPFGQIIDTDTESLNESLIFVSEIIGAMVYSATEGDYKLTPNESTILKDAVKIVWNKKKKAASIDDVRDVLNSYEEYTEFDHQKDNLGAEKFSTDVGFTARSMAYNLSDFCSAGVYGKWFNGPSTFNISDDDFVVLELENLKPMKELFPIVVGMVVNAIKNDIYLSDRSRFTLAIFDEAWQFMDKGGPIGMAIEEGYRRGRKYSSGWWTITQSAMDLERFGRVGGVINSQSSYKFYMQSDDFEKAFDAKIIDADPFVQNLLKSTKTVVPQYSEIYFKTESGSGHGRLIIDPYSYYLYTSNGKENAEMKEMVDSGMSWDEAIKTMVKKYRAA